jgi:hypothetical protein
MVGVLEISSPFVLFLSRKFCLGEKVRGSLGMAKHILHIKSLQDLKLTIIGLLLFYFLFAEKCT